MGWIYSPYNFDSAVLVRELTLIFGYCVIFNPDLVQRVYAVFLCPKSLPPFGFLFQGPVGDSFGFI